MVAAGKANPRFAQPRPLRGLLNDEGVLRALAIELAIGEFALSKLSNHADGDLTR